VVELPVRPFALIYRRTMTDRKHRLARIRFVHKPLQRAALSQAIRWLQVGGLLAALGTQAHASPCEQLKADIAQRMTMNHFVLEIMPTKQSLPRGAKVVGTCEGGARRVVLLRNGTALPAEPPQAEPVEPAVALSQPKPAPEPSPAKASPPVVAKVPPAPLSTPKSAPAPVPAPAPAPVAIVAQAPVPPVPLAPAVSAPVTVQEVAVPTAMPASATTPVLGESSPALAAASAVQSEPTANPPAGSASSAEPNNALALLSADVFGLLRLYWHWLLVLSVLLLLGWWRISHWLAYDANGLPRGPRL
jgi:outer membrane biosynthesis protein TonB